MRLLVFILAARSLFAAGTTVLFDPSVPATGPFPTDFLTVFDPLQKTGVRIDMPVPDCATRYTACQEGGLIGQLDGFSLRARARIRFSAAVNTGTLRDGVFYVALENISQDEPGIHKFGDRIRANQLVYDPATNTLFAKPDAVLDQHRRYALIVTDAVRDTAGDPVSPDAAFQACLRSGTEYCTALARATGSIVTAPQRIVAASVFTTLSATAWLEHARDILNYVPPVVTLAEPQSAFRISDIDRIVLHAQSGVNPPGFADVVLPIADQQLLLNGLDRIVLGSFRSPDFLEDDHSIRPAPTGPPFAVPDKTNQIYFNAYLPSTPKPAGGYPVVIFGHGFGDSRFGGPTAVAPALARAGMAAIAINAAGHGFGPLSSVDVVDKNGRSTRLPAGGRSVDINRDGLIESNEGCAIVSPVAYGPRDCFRQTVVDLMQLARVIRLGLDLDGDGSPDLDAGRIYYAGQSLGAIYGALFTAVEPTVRAAGLNVGGGTLAEIARWSPAYRSLTTEVLLTRVPALLNKGTDYDEDYVLPDQPVKLATVAGALDIQDVLENLEWLSMSGDPIAFAPHLKAAPLPGRAARPVLMQFARGDQTMPNTASTALVRGAGLESSTWMYRHDVARGKAPDLPANPHPYLVLFVSLNGGAIQLPGLAGLAISLDAQQQFATFLASDGARIADPNTLVLLLMGTRVFEIPAVLPQDPGF